MTTDPLTNRNEAACGIIRTASLRAFASSRERSHFFPTRRREGAKNGTAGRCPKILPGTEFWVGLPPAVQVQSGGLDDSKLWREATEGSGRLDLGLVYGG